MHALDPVRYTALITLLAIAVYFYSLMLVGRARGTFGIKAPATTGNVAFERIFRGQMNTLEWLPIFLPALWLFALSVSDALAAVLGIVWLVGRMLYITTYAAAADKRGPGFGVQAIAAIVLWIGALIRIGMSLIAG